MLLVDIDGVLNPWAAAQCPAGFREYAIFPDDEEPVRLATGHGVWLRQLARAYDLVWASGWGSEANEKIAPILGLPDLPHVPMPAIPFDPWLKVPAVSAYVGDRRVAWVDDAFGLEAWEWAASRRDLALLLPADPAVGLTRSHVQRLERWSFNGTDAGARGVLDG